VTIVAVLNATPDSFSDGGRFTGEAGQVNVDAAVDAAGALVAEGAHVLDVGGESTRPGAPEVSAELEMARAVPVVKALAKRFDRPISIDTRKAPVADAALEAGAALVNDVSGLRHDEGLAAVVARRRAGLVLGHSRGTPETMQDDPRYADTLREVADELSLAIGRAEAAGVPRSALCIDPGLGFGKRLDDNLRLLTGVGELRERLGLPLLVGPSRKAFLGALTGDPVEARDPASWAACAVAAFCGADAVRVHSVAGALRAVQVGRAARDAALRHAPEPGTSTSPADEEFGA